MLNTSPTVLNSFIDNINIFNFICDIDMLCYNNCYLLHLWDWRLLARAQTQKFQSWMWCWDWPRLKPRSFDLEYVIPAIDQATKLVCNSKSSMIDSLCVKIEIPLIGIPENLPWFLHPFTWRTFSFSSDCQGRHAMQIKCLQLVEWLVYLMGCFQNCVFSFP